MPATLHTAARIAASLDKTPQAVRKLLREVPAAGCVVVSGKEAQAWTWASLPATLQARLEAEARRRNYRGGPELLAAPPKLWQPAIPLPQLAQSCIDEADKLRRALAPALARMNDATLSRDDFEQAGVADYARVFGHTITARYWRELFKRTLARDAGAEDWGRLEVYLPDRLTAKQTPARLVSEALADEFAGIKAAIDDCHNPAAPNESERWELWRLAIEHFNRLVAEGLTRKQAKRRITGFLFARAAFLAPSREALLKSFDRRLADPDALKDRRKDNTGNHDGYELPEADRDLLIHRAVWKHGGRIAAAWQEVLFSGQLTPQTQARYFGKSISKSHVPEMVMESVRSEVEILSVLHRGPRAFDSAKGYVTRSYDGLASLRCMQADDFTMPIYSYVPDGNGWFKLVRGQCLIFIDFRTDCILGYSLQPDRNYNSLVIRSLCTHVFEQYGLPKVLYFERGIWESSKLLKGTEPFSFTEISQGLHEFGIRFIHAIRPRSKTVERVGRALQDLMEAEPGYCGREERKDAPESLRKQMALVEARKQHPAEFFYSFDQWDRRLGEIIAQYNNTRQEGRKLDNLTPEAALEKFLDPSDPKIEFDARIRFLLAHHKSVKLVNLNGLTLQYGKQRFNYRGQQVAHLVGREVLAWFDPENPEAIVITDRDRTPESAICVPRSQEVNAMEDLVSPGSETLAQELARVEHQASYMKARFHVLKTKFQLPARRNLIAAQTVELGQRIEAGKEALREKDRATQRNRVVADRLARKTGIIAPRHAPGRDVTPDGMDFLQDFLQGGSDETPKPESNE